MYCKENLNDINRDCFCSTLNREKLYETLMNDGVLPEHLTTHAHLFSNTSAFVSPTQLQLMQTIIQAATRVMALPKYQSSALTRNEIKTQINEATLGVFMGYDFHLSPQGPKIIEINTNAGGAFLNAALASAQIKCCCLDEQSLAANERNIHAEFLAMFLHEWQLQAGDKPLTRIAIVDENPTEQFLYPEFKMAQHLFESHGIQTIIAAPSDLQLTNGELFFDNLKIDLIYNRLTDFKLSSHPHILSAYQNKGVVLTPSPRHHALYADKRNLVILSQAELLKDLGTNEEDIAVLQTGIPTTQIVTAENADRLWSKRREFFFKPASGFGSRAAYRGDKLTKRVWETILQSDYVAQELIPPSERGIEIDGDQTSLKMDIRAYVYDGKVQLFAARLYQGQTTNFRTHGGGFAPVFVFQPSK